MIQLQLIFFFFLIVLSLFEVVHGKGSITAPFADAVLTIGADGNLKEALDVKWLNDDKESISVHIKLITLNVNEEEVSGASSFY